MFAALLVVALLFWQLWEGTREQRAASLETRRETANVALAIDANSRLPDGFYLVAESGPNVLYQQVSDSTGEEFSLHRRPIVLLRDIKDAAPSFGPDGRPIVNITLRAAAAPKMRQATTQNVGARMALVLDDIVLTAARINTPISDSSYVEGPDLTPEATAALAAKLDIYGALSD